MSMPSFPKGGANMTREQALTMIIASIAMEERALGRVIDAEADKLRYILDQYQETCDCGGTPEEILEVNRSVTALLEAAAQNQMMLRSKLALAVEATSQCPPDPPCPPPEPPSPPPCPPKPPCACCPRLPQKSLMQLGLPGSDFLWENECPLPWECLDERGNAVSWSRRAPSQVELEPGKAYLINCTFNIHDLLFTSVSGHISLACTDMSQEPLPLYFSIRCGGEAVTLQYSTLLLPSRPCAVSFRLHSKTALCAEQAQLNIAEL